MKYFTIVLILFICSCSTGTEGNNVEPTTTIPIHVYALMGQSNMEGTAYSNINREIDDRIMFLDLANELQIVTNTLHSEESYYPEIGNAEGYSLGISFADEMIKQYPDDKIILVTCARGGSTINEQLYNDQVNPFSNKKFSNNLSELCIERIENALTYDGAIFEGVLYYQGEFDIDKPEVWKTGMLDLIDKFEETFGAINFVFAQLCKWITTDEEIITQFNYFKEQQEKLSEEYGIKMVRTDDLELHDNLLHLSNESLREVGIRFAEKF